jgi:phosphonatase-like hydrolase
MSSVKLVVFDLAGTTVRDNGEVPSSFKSALLVHGVHVSDEQLENVRGSSKRQAVFDLLPESPERLVRAKEIYNSFQAELSARYRRDGVESIEGTESVFATLRVRGVRVVLNTGFDAEITSLLLEALGWNDGIVDAVVCGDDVAHGRPAPDLIFAAMNAVDIKDTEIVANVGDTVLDLEAAHNAGVKWNVGVLSGAHSFQRLQPAPHTHLINSVAQLPELLFR